MTRWRHEDVLEAVEQRLDESPEKMRHRRETVEHPFGTIKFWMGSTHFQMKGLKWVGTEMALHVLAYNLKRVMNIMGIGPPIEAMGAASALASFHLRPYPAGSEPQIPTLEFAPTVEIGNLENTLRNTA